MAAAAPGVSGIRRIYPSVEALQEALTYGMKIKCGTRVAKIGKDRVVQGEQFDTVVVASEASAVKHILSDAPAVFERISYQPSCIVLHTDASVMPSSRSEWRALNVKSTTDDEQMSQLTVWLNKYYPELDFAMDTFETWNPHTAVPPSSVLGEVHFWRSLHGQDSNTILEDIAALQGRDGIYFAGSYAVAGMGLLEEGVQSGQVVAEQILASRRAA